MTENLQTKTKTPLRVLHLEDDRDYSALVQSTLTAAGFALELLCVESECDFRAALEKQEYDLIIADYHLPTYNGVKAIQVALEKQPATPTLLISGTIGEDAAIESLKGGASDYVLKHWPEKLLPAVQRALREAEERKCRLRAEQERDCIARHNASLSALGLKLSCVISAEEAAKVIVETANELFGWDACTLNLYSPDEDKIYPILTIDTIRGEKKEIPKSEIQRNPTTRSRRIINQGAELVLRQPPLAMNPDSIAFGDKTRPSASLMFVPVRNRTRVTGILSIQSYQLNAYSEKDLAALQTLADHCGGALERIRVEQALRGSEIRFHSVWDNSVDGMRLTDEKGIILAVNESFCKLVGMRREELEGQIFIVPYAESSEPKRKLAHYLEHFKDRSLPQRFERKLTFRNGKTVQLEGSNSFVECNGQTTLLGLFRDITEHRRLEEKLLQSQKMDAIGQLAGGIAHDFNNILTIIQGHASLLRASGPVSGPLSGSAQQISEAAERAAGLTRQLLTFSRRQMMQPKALDLNTVVSNMSRMLGRILGEDIALQFSYAPGLPLVHADAGMMEQILLNLAVNSRDAMPAGGQLNVRISMKEIRRDAPPEHSEGYPGRFVCVSVQDTGIGIAPAILPHIFEPFFTTKSVGKGTGLGLATVYGIVKQHRGWVEVESQLSRGATFHVYLPSSCETKAKSAGDTTAEEALRGGTETILVVEDEPPVRDLVSKVLTSRGYHVLQATSGTHALNVWREQKDNINLLLTDIVMPDGMTGRDLAEKVQADRPGTKAIFTSGYSADIVGKDFVIQEGLNFLQKPYAPNRLVRMIRKCLDDK